MWYVWYISSLMQMVNDAVLKAYLARWNSTILLQKRPTFFLLRPELVYNLRQGRIYHANTALLHLSLLSIWLIDLYMKIYIYICMYPHPPKGWFNGTLCLPFPPIFPSNRLRTTRMTQDQNTNLPVLHQRYRVPADESSPSFSTKPPETSTKWAPYKWLHLGVTKTPQLPLLCLAFFLGGYNYNYNSIYNDRKGPHLVYIYIYKLSHAVIWSEKFYLQWKNGHVFKNVLDNFKFKPPQNEHGPETVVFLKEGH